MFYNKILKIFLFLFSVMVGIGEQVYSVLLLSFFFLEVNCIFTSLYSLCVPVFVHILHVDEPVTAFFVLQFFKHIVSLEMLLIYNNSFQFAIYLLFGLQTW